MGCSSGKAATTALQPAPSTLLQAPVGEGKAAKDEGKAANDTLRLIFEGMDTNADGKIDIKELNMALRKSEEMQKLFNVKYYSGCKGVGKGQGAPPLPAFFTQQIEKVDIDGDGKISLEEFQKYFFPSVAGQADNVAAWASLWKAFNAIDTDGDGKIEVKELNKGLRESQDIQRLFNVEYYSRSKGKGKGSSPPLPSFFRDLISKFDSDGDGKISWREFSTYFQQANSMH